MAIQKSELIQVGLALNLADDVKDFENCIAEVANNYRDGAWSNYMESRAALKAAILASCGVPCDHDRFLAIWFFLDQPDFESYSPRDCGISFSRADLESAYPKVWAAFAACGRKEYHP